MGGRGGVGEKVTPHANADVVSINLTTSVNDEHLRTGIGSSAMATIIVSNDEATASGRGEAAAVFEIAGQRSVDDEHNVPFGAPMICLVARTEFDRPNA